MILARAIFGTLIIAFCLFGNVREIGSCEILNQILGEITGTCQDSNKQWLLVAGFGVYAGIFSIAFLYKKRQIWIYAIPDLLLMSILLIAISVYAVDYSTASKSTQALVLTCAVILGKGWKIGAKSEKPSCTPIFFSIFCYTLLLATAFFWSQEPLAPFFYRNEVRSCGPWGHPNVFGLLMGSGTLLTLGVGATLMLTTRLSWKIGTYAAVGSCFSVAMMMGLGVLHSYSRGAWLGVICGLTYMAFRSTKMASLGFLEWARNNICPLLAIAFSICALSAFYLADWHPVQRVLSAVNSNDFSWRNRVRAWEGALQITAKHPWLGASWNQPQLLYEHYYLPPKLNESGAFEMNDYLMLGASLGIGALFCLWIYLWMTLTIKTCNHLTVTARMETEGRKQKVEIAQIDLLRVTCQSAAIVLLVGFWFDSGLFKLPTAASCWILLELGRAENQP